MEVSRRLVVGERSVHGRVHKVGYGKSGSICLLRREETVVEDDPVQVTVLSRVLEFGGWRLEYV